jgi:hypothetical protein
MMVIAWPKYYSIWIPWEAQDEATVGCIIKAPVRLSPNPDIRNMYRPNQYLPRPSAAVDNEVQADRLGGFESDISARRLEGCLPVTVRNRKSEPRGTWPLTSFRPRRIVPHVHADKIWMACGGITPRHLGIVVDDALTRAARQRSVASDCKGSKHPFIELPRSAHQRSSVRSGYISG